MNGIHDMGGMHGFGPIAPEADEPVFHALWEKRVLALTLAVNFAGRWNIDAGRYERELQPPGAYLAWSYYESWFERLKQALVKTGLVTAREIASGRAETGAPVATLAPALAIAQALAAGAATSRPATAPARFRPGDRVRARNLNPAGHTRLPRYVRGHIGVIARDHGFHVLPDSNAHFRGERPERLYGVAFDAVELWGAGASRGEVHLDLWDSYLEPA